MNKFLTSKKKKNFIFSKEFTAEKFLWNLTLENFSIFYQSLRDCNCGSNRCMVHAGYQNVSPGLGEHVGKFFLWPIAFPATLWKIVFQLFFHTKIWSLAKFSQFGQFGRPIGRCGQSHMNQLDIFSSKKFTISRNSQ